MQYAVRIGGSYLIITLLTGQDYTYTFPLVMLKDGVVPPFSVSSSVEEYPFGLQGLNQGY